jgi:hypothetical protein
MHQMCRVTAFSVRPSRPAMAVLDRPSASPLPQLTTTCGVAGHSLQLMHLRTQARHRSQSVVGARVARRT